MIKKIFTISLIFLLESCIVQAGFKPDIISENRLIEQRFPDNKKAIIIIGNVDEVYNTASLWYKVDRMSGSHYNNKNLYINRTKKKQILMLEPGTYSLKSFGIQNTSNVSSWVETSKKLYNPETKEPAIVSFTVEAGEVVYLGDIKLSSYAVGKMKWGSSQRDVIIRVDVSNNSEDAEREFYSAYPKFKDYKIATRIIVINEKNK
jgi:hypothetical protein